MLGAPEGTGSGAAAADSGEAAEGEVWARAEEAMGWGLGAAIAQAANAALSDRRPSGFRKMGAGGREAYYSRGKTGPTGRAGKGGGPKRRAVDSSDDDGAPNQAEEVEEEEEPEAEAAAEE